jgi:hypothetical protein
LKFDETNSNFVSELDSKEKNFDILFDIWDGIGSKMEFISRDLDFNKFSLLERFKPFLNRKFGIWLEDSKFKSSALNQGHLTKAGI